MTEPEYNNDPALVASHAALLEKMVRVTPLLANAGFLQVAEQMEQAIAQAKELGL